MGEINPNTKLQKCSLEHIVLIDFKVKDICQILSK